MKELLKAFKESLWEIAFGIIAITFIAFLFVLYGVFSVANAKPMVGIWEPNAYRVIDGDTVELSLTIWPKMYVLANVRLVGIDTPEIYGKCDKERELAARAANRVSELLANADIILLTNVDKDKFYGRVVGDIIVDGRTIQSYLLNEMLARPYDGKNKRLSWCD